MRNHPESTRTAIEAPEIFLAISRMREKAFVLTLEVYKEQINLSIQSRAIFYFNFSPNIACNNISTIS